jgi:hypothetical protein
MSEKSLRHATTELMSHVAAHLMHCRPKRGHAFESLNGLRIAHLDMLKVLLSPEPFESPVRKTVDSELSEPGILANSCVHCNQRIFYDGKDSVSELWRDGYRSLYCGGRRPIRHSAPQVSVLSNSDDSRKYADRPIGFVKHNGAGEIVFRQAGHPSNDPMEPWVPVYTRKESS